MSDKYYPGWADGLDIDWASPEDSGFGEETEEEPEPLEDDGPEEVGEHCRGEQDDMLERARRLK